MDVSQQSSTSRTAPARMSGRRLTSPLAWAPGVAAPPIISSDAGSWSGALLRRWRDVEPDIAQPALDQHYLTIHLGGAKRVERRGEGARRAIDIDPGAMSIVPAGAAFDWSTRGPVDFAHIYLAPEVIERAGREEFDRDTASLVVGDRLGIRDPLLEAVLLAMLRETEAMAAGSRVYLDTLLQALVLRLLRDYAGAPAAPLVVRHSLAPTRLRRTLDFIEANFAADIGLADLAAVAASSPFHFSRAFAAATGRSPYKYLIGRRIEHAKAMLLDGDASIAAIARQAGFQSAGQFARMFRQSTGRSPRRFRNDTR